MPYLLQQLLTESAENNPNKIAVVHKNNKITYSEIDIVSNQLSNRLLSEGIKKGDRVGFYLNKSIESIISIFAIIEFFKTTIRPFVFWQRRKADTPVFQIT